jgi:hypothetical protein
METKTSDRDFRLAVQLKDTLDLQTSDSHFLAVWRVFFALGHCDSRKPPGDWDL